MKYAMIQKTGALQEGVTYNQNLSKDFEDSFQTFSQSANFPSKITKSISKRRASHANLVGGKQNIFDDEGIYPVSQCCSPTPAILSAPDLPTQQVAPIPSQCCTPAAQKRSFFPSLNLNLRNSQNRNNRSSSSVLSNSSLQERKGMFFYTISEGQRVLVTDKSGRAEIIDGPRRIRSWGKRIQYLQQHIAYPGEFLIIKYRNGSQTHIAGPCQEWLDPRIHAQIEKNDSLQIAGKEAVVVYAKGENDRLIRHIIQGPALFIPKPGEWLHTFTWHGNKDGQYKKVPGGLVFQKLWLMPDQMYHDVENVCTSDDVTMSVKLMIFFELLDVEKMLEGTHDPIGDFINATSSDVIDLVKRYTFDEFKTHSEKLNDLESYPQLKNRAQQVGYAIHKIVYRGYTTEETLQNMQNTAIETRIKLKLERETEEQTQKLTDYKQKCEAERAIQRRQQEKEQERHILETQKIRHQQQMELQEQDQEIKLKHSAANQQQQLQFFQKLNELNVDLTKYLTQLRADKIIELRGNNTTPHIHLDDEQDEK